MSYAPPPITAVPPGDPALPVGPVPAHQSVAPQALAPLAPAAPLALPVDGLDIRERKSNVEFGLREYLSLQNRRFRTDEVGVEERLRVQAGALASELRTLRRAVSALAKTAESRRWRRWITGTIVASFVPAIQAIFRRPAGETETETSNNTEYAFHKSKHLLARIRDSVRGKGRLASLAFLVFAVLYVFSNEVSLRVARTISKRLKRLSAKMEDGGQDLDERDIDLLNGWRWRVLLWNQ